ncbi:MAG: Mbeg1-like protein [Erysipelotrichaceae bacterium]
MNMIDYIKWRGDLTMSKDKFNIVDNLLFSYISYTNLDGIVDNSGKEVTIKQAADCFFESHTIEELEKSKSLIANAPIVLKYMAETERFKNCRLKYYEHNIDEETTQQFSAVHIVMDDDITYISFCGTDDTLVGWQEDFQMSYQEVSAQRQAIRYLNETAKDIGKFYVGGHSKGGNLAYYSASKCNKEIQDNIIMIYDNDGPGISDELFDQKQYENTIDRYVKIIPEFSVFGLIFERPCKKIIVESDQLLILQHIAHCWKIQGNDFIRAEKVTDESLMIQSALNNFLKDVNLKQREKFINDFFNILHDADVEMLYDFVTMDIAKYVKIIKKLFALDDETKKVGSRLLQVITDVVEQERDKIFSSASDYFKEKKDDVSTFFKETSDDVSEFIKTTSTNVYDSMKKTFDDITEPDKNKDQTSSLINDKKEKET